MDEAWHTERVYNQLTSYTTLFGKKIIFFFNCDNTKTLAILFDLFG